MSLETIMGELGDLTLGELQRLRVATEKAERERRTIENAAAQIDAVNRRVGEEMGRQLGDAWAQPQGAVDAYPEGAVVAHAGATWRSLTAGNVWEPGVSGWREIAESEAVPPEYVQPTGAHDAYGIDDRVRWGGNVWRSTIAGNVWDPQAYPDGWVDEGRIPDDMLPPAEGEDAPVPVWEPGLALAVGDRVEYNGVTYVVVQAHTAQTGWEPTNLPALFETEET